MIRNISTEELKGMMDSGQSFVLVNVLDSAIYENEHICGSINIPVKEIEKEGPRLLNRDETVVVHCSGPACTASITAGTKLETIGYRDIRVFRGGIEEWKKAGVKSARVMKLAVAHLVPYIEEEKRQHQAAGLSVASKGRIVVATVKGDVHDIGKNIGHSERRTMADSGNRPRSAVT